MQGIVTIGGRQFVERLLYIPATVTITANGQIFQGREVLNGTAPVMLKGLAREVIVSNAPAVRRFKFKLSGTDGQFMAAGVGGTSDRVLDSLIFGDGRWPGVISPHPIYAPTASILYEVEDISNSVPYTIHMNFMGSYLIPFQGAANGTQQA